tara:strand:- start:1924 stop:2868 length:945 start_codon:yes stop_codon:yes gene_type:complete
MAVYTSVNKDELNQFLENYDLGSLISYDGIVEGIENTNFKIITEKGNYILTIFEKRVKTEDVPFFMSLQKHLSEAGFACPIPIENNNNKIINTLCNKTAIIISFLEGKKANDIKPMHCLQVGDMISNFQKITKNFSEKRNNSLHLDNWKSIFSKCLKVNDHKYLELISPIKNELKYLENHWPSSLPHGIIHGDIFQDNVFFIKNKLSGLIDFYFSCNDYYAYELALTTNAWCFDKKNSFNNENFTSLLEGYLKFSKLNSDEKNHFNTLLRGAAMRILVTRLHDQLFHPDGAIVIPKNPMQYFEILKWHQSNKIL